jgi:hypothetical protein
MAKLAMSDSGSSSSVEFTASALKRVSAVLDEYEEEAEE